MKKKVVMVGRDKAPSNAFERAASLLDSEYEVKTYLGHGDPIRASVDEIAADARSAHVLLCGMSSSPKLVAEELAAIRTAHSVGVPVILYADTHGAVKRSWFEDVREYVDGVLVISHKEAKDARALFPHVGSDGIILSGNPSVEEAFFPKVTRQEVRERLGVREDEKVILVPGYKFPAVTMPTVMATIDALNMVHEYHFFLVVSLHPGDDAWKANNSIYNDWIGYFLNVREVTDLADHLRVRVTCSKHPNEDDRIGTSDILPGADLVVATMSTEEQRAACQRIPVVEYLTSIALDRMEKNFGTRDWEPCVQGIAVEVFADHRELADAILFLITTAGRRYLRDAQEFHYPKPKEPGHALKVMVETVKRYASRS